ncbi:MAG TPA: hypothetical protein VF142_14585 [Longimicrobium sp.]
MDPDRIDLSPLGLDDLRRARMARAVMARAQLAGPRTPLAMLAGWARPTLAAAAVVAAVSVGALAWPSANAAQTSSPLTIADALDIPEPAADLIAEQRAVSDDDLLISWEPRP